MENVKSNVAMNITLSCGWCFDSGSGGDILDFRLRNTEMVIITNCDSVVNSCVVLEVNTDDCVICCVDGV